MGTKNKSLSSQDKSKDSKGSKKKEKEGGGSPKAEITVMLTEEQASKAIKNSKVITVQELARQTGVKISAANSYLRQAAEKGQVKEIGGYSGHRIYQQAS